MAGPCQPWPWLPRSPTPPTGYSWRPPARPRWAGSTSSPGSSTPRGLGFGDVRLAFVLGWCLGFAGLQPLVMGLYAPFILSILLMPLLALLRVVKLRSFAFGPFMLLGSILAVLSLAVPL